MALGLTCFLIDDDADDREIFTTALEDVDKNYKCLTALNGKDALEKLKGDETLIPDFIFLDLNMPIMTGKECLQEIKNIQRLNATPVIIYTTSSHPKDIEETKQLRASHYLIKPPCMIKLTKILSDFFSLW